MDDQLQSFINEIQRLFPRIMRYLEAEASRELIGLEVTPSQMNALFALYGVPNLPMGELAEQLGLTESAATRLVDRLINMNLVRRERDDQDRRVVRVRLSSYGKQLAELVFERRQAQFSRFAERLDQKSRDALIFGLSELLNVFGILEQESKSSKK
ncbi:MAG: MarR family transcriptional regulator [Sulfobacillus thermosulfidooxidans]|uniref:MarR family transcriptional regulator n=1 Tax=Sulfobacillus thermotolerans TaxID=338644 RepID=A0ABM6RN38_9FIRM|nr:MarR family transcriptional regulator [Sulfobacillus sp. hq2]AUW92731.1 MarR family transcriptional regulator [Sulfobacillus thermotolerans]MCY0907675.1 MarR family transcriptional regulator [Sulfobacillus thermotolerans]POB12126.1 MarR family transcriptional regulator [Sulfobacillus sp. hq2]PSR36948.1 MAG: MarR family transcriptional regulator [Sulfobacillus thermosulfidooxidans]